MEDIWSFGLSQMLSKDKIQVSEQWSGGLSIFTEFLKNNKYNAIEFVYYAI